MRSRHCIPDRLVERLILPVRLFPSDAQADGLALESRAPSFGYTDHRPRSGDTSASAAAPAGGTCRFLRPETRAERICEGHPQRSGSYERGGKDIRTGVRMAARRSRGSPVGRSVCRCPCSCARHSILVAAALHRTAIGLWCLALQFLWADAACVPAGECSRSPPQLTNGADEPRFAISLLEYELPYRTSHVPDGALPRVTAPS